jgi:hypothetical protein
MTKITIERETLERVIEALKIAVDCRPIGYETMTQAREAKIHSAIAALRAALAAQPAEPVAFDFSDAYQGAQQEMNIWRNRALLAEKQLRLPIPTPPYALVSRRLTPHVVEVMRRCESDEPKLSKQEAWTELVEAAEKAELAPLYAAPPAPAPVPLTDEMDAVARQYAHKMALDLECILAEYGGSWYNTAMRTLGEYRSAMNAIHERESPTFMGEPSIAASPEKKP